MHIRPNTLVVDDEHVPAATAAGSAEPMRRADHKSKKHPRPARKSEKLGGGHLVFRRHADGRIHPRQDPFEHGTFDEAATEVDRLIGMHGGTFEVFSRSMVASGEKIRSYDDLMAAADMAVATIIDERLNESELVDDLAGLGPVDDNWDGAEEYAYLDAVREGAAS